MKNIQDKIENLIYGYEPGQFMPILENGQVSNKGAFVAYKLKSLLPQRISDIIG